MLKLIGDNPEAEVYHKYKNQLTRVESRMKELEQKHDYLTIKGRSNEAHAQAQVVASRAINLQLRNNGVR